MDTWTESQGEGKKARESIELEKDLKMGMSGRDNISKGMALGNAPNTFQKPIYNIEYNLRRCKRQFL